MRKEGKRKKMGMGRKGNKGKKGKGMGRKGTGSGRKGSGRKKDPPGKEEGRGKCVGRRRKAWGLASPLARPGSVCRPTPAAPTGLGQISQPCRQRPPQNRARSPPGPSSPTTTPGRDISTLPIALHCKSGVKSQVLGSEEESPPAPMHYPNCTPIFKALPPGLSSGGSLHPPGPRVQVGDVPPSTHGCSAPLYPIPVPSYLGDAAVSPPPRDVGAPHAAAVPHSPTFRRRRRRRRTVCAAALLPDKHGQVGSAMAGGQEPGDEWEPGPAPSGSRETAGSAKPRAGFTATTRPPWGKASRGGWETRPLWMKSLFQSQRKTHGVENVRRWHGHRLGTSKTILQHTVQKKPLFLPQNVKLPLYPSCLPGGRCR